MTPKASLHFNGGTLLFQLRLDAGGFVLRDAGLHGLRRAIDHVLGFLQAKTGDFANDLDDLDLLATGLLEDHVELGLLFGRRGSGAAATRATGRRSSRRSGD